MQAEIWKIIYDLIRNYKGKIKRIDEGPNKIDTIQMGL